jgi:ankyrin repeat protein
MSEPPLRAIAEDDVSRVAAMIADGSLDVNATRFHSSTNNTNTPLMVAALNGRRAIVRLLLEKGARIDDCNNLGERACHLAALRGDEAVLNELIAHGANLGLASSESNTPLSLAVMRSHENIVFALIKAGAPLDQRETLCRAAALSARVIHLMLKRGVDFAGLRDQVGNTPCHIASRNKASDLAVVQTLVRDARVDVRLTDHSDNTCCHLMAFSGNERALHWLLTSGVDFDLEARDNLQQTPLRDACAQLNIGCVRLLLAAGANVHAKNHFGQTPLHVAARRRGDTAESIVKLLLAVGADLDVIDNSDLTPRDSCGIDFALPSAEELDFLRKGIGALRLELVSGRALQVCIGLQPLNLDALCMCEILQYACGQVSPLIPFHQWWKIATIVKHHHHQRRQE